jgi:hypothetical protein
MDAAVAKLKKAARDSGDALAGKDDSNKVERIGRRDGDEGSAVAATGCAEGFYGVGKGELLAPEAADEATTTNLTAGFEAAKDAEEVPPFGSVGFADEEVAEEDSVAG